MNTFTSLKDPIFFILNHIVENCELHAKWLNTLSFLENCGARLIASCEHPTLVKEEMLKHAAEEFRHAHYLKRQIGLVSNEALDTYEIENLLGGVKTLHYLQFLNLKTCRFLKEQGLKDSAFKEMAYLLVTYAIELRAKELYPLYDRLLREKKSKVRVKSILLEEEEHLKEMENALVKTPFGLDFAKSISTIESELCHDWLEHIKIECNESYTI